MSARPGNQISISAIMPNEREVWHLSVRFRDRRGLLAELSKLLTAESVNIISCQSSSHVQNREFIVERDAILLAEPVLEAHRHQGT